MCYTGCRRNVNLNIDSDSRILLTILFAEFCDFRVKCQRRHYVASIEEWWTACDAFLTNEKACYICDKAKLF